MSAKHEIALAFLVLLAAGCGTDATAPESRAPVDPTLQADGATVNPTDITVIPIDGYFWDPCAGEVMHFTGEYVISRHYADPADPATTEETFRVRTLLRNWAGVGLTSGDLYRVTGNDGGTWGPASYGSNGERMTSVVRQQLMRQGDGRISVFTITFHYVANSSGTVLDGEPEETFSCS